MISTAGAASAGQVNNAIVRHVFAIGLLLILIISTPCVRALLCYTCSYTAAEWGSNQTCVLNAKVGQVTDCDKKYCTIVRQELVNPPHKVVSFIRDCLDKPLFINSVKTDETFKTYYRSCKKDLCNDSDGTFSATAQDPNFGAAPNQIIKGKRDE